LAAAFKLLSLSNPEEEGGGWGKITSVRFTVSSSLLFGLAST